MSIKKYRKKPVEVQAWAFPETMTAQANLSRELEQLGTELALYDYAVEKSDTPFKDGAFWRWSQAHIAVGMRSHIARVGDIIILDPVTGWGVVGADLFAAIYEEVQNE